MGQPSLLQCRKIQGLEPGSKPANHAPNRQRRLTISPSASVRGGTFSEQAGSDDSGAGGSIHSQYCGACGTCSMQRRLEPRAQGLVEQAGLQQQLECMERKRAIGLCTVPQSPLLPGLT